MEIHDLHIHVHCELPERVTQQLDELLTRVTAIQAQETTIMSNETDLQTDLDAIQTAVGTVLAAQTAQAATIADLRAQLAAGTPVSQAQLDSLDAEAKAIVATLTPLAPSA